MPSGRESPGGRRASDRGRYGRLSKERVLASALEVVDRDGLSGLSMRKLGAELGVEAMALYRYAPGKDALLDGLVEGFCLELEADLAAGPKGVASAQPGGGGSLPEPGARGERREADGRGADGRGADDGRRGAGAWVQELHRIALATYRVALRHPNVVPLLATRLLSTPMARRPTAVLRSDERVLALLHDAGIDESRSVALHRAFTAWLLGYLLVELRAMDDEPAEPDPAFRLGLHRISAQELPRLRATALSLTERGGPADLAAGLDALIDRLRQH